MLFLSRFFNILAVLFCIVGTAITSSSQTQRESAQNPDRLVVNTGEVLLDVVVRDKRGRVVKELDLSDFEVYEDGVKQPINSFRFVSAANSESEVTRDLQSKQSDPKNREISPASSTGRQSVAAPGINVIALVFDRLNPDARARATQAALNYLQESAQKDELFGVFLTDLSVVVVQSLTLDRELVKAGIQKVGVHSPSLYNSTNEDARNSRQILTSTMEIFQNPLLSKEGLPPATSAPSLSQAGAMASLQLGLLDKAEQDQRDELGDATARGLLHIASSLSALPGRKAIIFFSEGLILPPSVMQTFPAIINAANRNNVSFYTVDAAGLRAESKTLETTKEIESHSKFRMAQLGANADADGPMTKDLERNEDLLRLNPESGLARLANETGGFLIMDSNDLKSRLRQVDEDLHSYYLMTYLSNNQNYDGHFRTIEVKLKRSGLTTQSRKGYFAINNSFLTPVLPYEAPALAALDATPKANSFTFHAGGFSFPERQRKGLTSIVVDVPLSAVSFKVDQDKKTYVTNFSVVALIKNAERQVVGKLSRQYQLIGPIDKIDATKSGHVLFYRETELAPGRYSLDTIAYDALTNRSSVISGTLEVFASDENKPRLSDVVILKRAESTSAKDSADVPFRVGNVIVSPNLGEPIPRSLQELPIFFTVYTADNGSRPKLSIELQQKGRTLAQMNGDLPEPDTLGRIQYLAGLPLQNIPPGVYELKIVVSHGTATLSRTTHFTIEQ